MPRSRAHTLVGAGRIVSEFDAILDHGYIFADHNARVSGSPAPPCFAALCPQPNGILDLAPLGRAAATPSFSRSGAAWSWDESAMLFQQSASNVARFHGLRDNLYWRATDGTPLHPVSAFDGGMQFQLYHVAKRGRAYAVGDRVQPDGLRPYSNSGGSNVYDQRHCWLECTTAGTSHATNSINGAWTITSINWGVTTITDGTVVWTVMGRYCRHGMPGVHVEQERTQLVTGNASRNYNDVFWTKFNSLTVSSGTALDGTAQNNTLIDNSGVAQQRLQASLSASASTTYALSCFVKKDAQTDDYGCLNLQFDGTGTLRNEPRINKRTGQIGHAAGLDDGDSYVEDWGDWWRLISVLTSASDTTSMTISIFPGRDVGLTDPGANAAQGTWIVDFIQLETSTYASSPIGATTRNEESLSYTGWAVGVDGANTILRADWTVMAESEHNVSNCIITNQSGDSVGPLYVEGRDYPTKSDVFAYDNSASTPFLQEIFDLYAGYQLGITHGPSGATGVEVNGMHTHLRTVIHWCDDDSDPHFSNPTSVGEPGGRIQGWGYKGDADRNSSKDYLYSTGLPALYIGTNSSGTRHANAVISDLMIWPDALTTRTVLDEPLDIYGGDDGNTGA